MKTRSLYNAGLAIVTFAMAVGGDMQPAAKLLGSGYEGGGYWGVNHPSGKPALMLTSTHHGGGIVSSNRHGETLDVWPSGKMGRRADPEQGNVPSIH